MGKTGPEFYDDQAVFATYVRRRERADSPNETLEKPVITELIGEVAGKRILDLGCGSAAMGRELLEQGAAGYLGIEGSQNMVALAAQTLAGTTGRAIRQTLEEWSSPPATFDLVLSRLALHYVNDLTPVFASAFVALVPGGRFVFSVEHPVITSSDKGWSAQTPRQDWVVDDYFSTGLRVTNWMGGTVQKYHRTVEDYFSLLEQAGFIVERLREAAPQHEHFQDAQLYERRKRIPLFLIMASRKPNSRTL